MREQPAFPNNPDGAEGLTKREWYAGMAMQGYLSASAGMTSTGPGKVNVLITQISEIAFMIADAMLNEEAPDAK